MLGVVPVEPSAAKVKLSPYLSGLKWAKGTVATARGTISVGWKLVDNNTVEINYTDTAPETISVEFAKNPSLEGKTIILNGKKI